jgi:hypothetical protein
LASSNAADADSRSLWGLYEVTIDTSDGTVEAVPLRTALIRANVNNLMEKSSTGNLLFQNLDLTEFPYNGRVWLDVGLKHPFPGMDQFTGFDVYGVFMHDGSGSLTYDGLGYPVEGSDAVLLNADGYTRWFNRPEFTGSMIAGYTPGKLGTAGFQPSATLNGYRIFADGLSKEEYAAQFLFDENNFNDRLMFRSGSLNWRTYELQFPMPGGTPVLKFQYAVHASWEPPVQNPPLQVPEDFPIEANIQEACLLRCWPADTLWWKGPDDWGGDLKLDIYIYDWQGAYAITTGIPEEIHDVKVAGNFIPVTYDGGFEITGGDSHYSTVHVEIPESMLNLTGPDGNECFVIVESENPSDYSDSGIIPPGDWPDNAALAAFLRVQVPVNGNAAPDVGEIEGPEDPCTNTEIVYTLTYATDPDGDPLTILWENDGDDDFADDMDGDDSNLSGTLSFPSVGSYTVKAKVSDGVNEVVVELGVVAKICGEFGMTDVTPPGWPAFLRDVEVEDDYAFAVGPYGGLLVLDVSGSGNPAYAGGSYDVKEGLEVRVKGDYCYVADGSNGMRILDITDPTEPDPAGSYDCESANGIFVSDDGFLYVANGKYDLLILDIGGGTQGGSPTDPKLEGSHSVSYAALCVYEAEGLAFVGDYENGLRIYDVGDGTWGGSPSNPVEISFVSGYDQIEDIIALGTFVYFAAGDQGIITVDITEPWLPKLSSTFVLSTWAYDLWIDDGYLYAAVDTGGLITFSMSEPGAPSYSGHYNTPGNSLGVCKTGDYAYVADYYYGLRKIDVTDPSEPDEVGKYYTPANPYDLQVVGGYVYLADDGLGLEVVDIGGGVGAPEEPLTVARWDPPPDCRGVFVEDGYAYLGGGWFGMYMYVVDVGAGSGAPDNPVFMGQCSSIHTYGLQKMDEYVYAAGYDEGMKVFDVDGGALGGSPSNPKHVTTCPTNTAWELWAEDGYVYVADGNNIEARFYVFDVGGGTGSPTSPKIADSMIVPEHLYDVNLVDGYAFCSGSDGLRVFDVGGESGAPDDIIEVATWPFPGVELGRGIFAGDGFAFIVCSNGMMYAFDVGCGLMGGAPDDPQVIESIQLPGDLFAVMVEGEYAYVASHMGGLRVVKLWN